MCQVFPVLTCIAMLCRFADLYARYTSQLAPIRAPPSGASSAAATTVVTTSTTMRSSLPTSLSGGTVSITSKLSGISSLQGKANPIRRETTSLIIPSSLPPGDTSQRRSVHVVVKDFTKKIYCSKKYLVGHL